MAHLTIENVRIVGMSAAVPQRIVSTRDERLFSNDYAMDSFIKMTGVEQRRLSHTMTGQDLCYEAAKRLMEDLKWSKEDIDAIVVVTITPDYELPCNACILQERLGLKKECYAHDISMACSGWPYGLSVASSLMSRGDIKKAILMAGDGKLLWNSEDSGKLFGHGATATALEYSLGEEGLKFTFGTDGSGYETLMLPDTGMRNAKYPERITEEMFEGDKKYSMNVQMNGLDLYSFSISVVPKAIKEHSQYFGWDYQKSDYMVLHQANKNIMEKIGRKLDMPMEKVPISIHEYGNIGAGTIPLTIVSQLKGSVENKKTKFMCVGFGTGLSWGVVHFTTEKLMISDVVEVPEITEESKWI